MAKITKNDAGVYTETANPSLVDNMTAGFQAPFLKEGEALDRSSARWSALIYGVGGLILGSMGARARVAQGKDPIARVFL